MGTNLSQVCVAFHGAFYNVYHDAMCISHSMTLFVTLSLTYIPSVGKIHTKFEMSTAMTCNAEVKGNAKMSNVKILVLSHHLGT